MIAMYEAHESFWDLQSDKILLLLLFHVSNDYIAFEMAL